MDFKDQDKPGNFRPTLVRTKPEFLEEQSVRRSDETAPAVEGCSPDLSALKVKDHIRVARFA